MPTGACGINCDTCKLKLLEICSSCGPGRSLTAMQKLAAQERILGAPCPILACAQHHQVDYCLRDCPGFPCDHFNSGYPFGQPFLASQARRRREHPPALTPNRTPLTVPSEYWDELATRDIPGLCGLTLAEPHPEGGLVFPSLNRLIWLDTGARRLAALRQDRWEAVDDPRLEVLALLYFTRVQAMHPVGRDIVGIKDLKEAHYFKDQHALDLGPLLECFGEDLEGFRRAAENLRGRPQDMADMAYMLLPFPRVPVYFLLWRGDEEFPPQASVLLDRPIEACFQASAIWLLVKLVAQELLRGPAEMTLGRT